MLNCVSNRKIFGHEIHDSVFSKTFCSINSWRVTLEMCGKADVGYVVRTMLLLCDLNKTEIRGHVLVKLLSTYEIS